MGNVRKLLLGAFRHAGIGRLVRNSTWRARRLLVLCWHGISLNDEHLWRPGLYTSPVAFRRQLEAIRASGCTVLTLHEGLERMWRGSLPAKSVVLTFDDGFYDFYAAAAPILQEFGFPATVYLTTYYVDFQKPVFPSILSYLAWNGCRQETRLNRAEIRTLHDGALEHASRNRFSAAEKDDLVRDFAGRAGIDYDSVSRLRLLHLMNSAEVGELARSGNFFFEMHTHRHRTPGDPLLLLRELQENQARIRDLTGRTPVHFCYPGGVVSQDMFPVLDRAGVRSAATCEPGLVHEATNPYLVPRLLDVPAVDELTFQSWLDGTPAILGYGRFSAAQVPVSLNVHPSAPRKGENEATAVSA